MRILLIEDEKELSEALVYVLKKEKYEADAAYDGLSGCKMAESGIYDIIILDWMLPGKSGIEILADVRSAGIYTPVLILTARHTEADKIKGLDAGADDYLIKPFSNGELLARIRALGRRKAPINESETIEIGKCIFCPRKGELTYIIGDGIINLTLKETSILELLCDNIGSVVTKDMIINKVWGGSAVEVNNIEVFISYLRKKIDPRLCGFNITTIRGTGYMLKIL